MYEESLDVVVVFQVRGDSVWDQNRQRWWRYLELDGFRRCLGDVSDVKYG